MKDETPEFFYGIRYRIPGKRNWQFDDIRQRADREEIERMAEEWWGESGHKCEWEIVTFRRVK
jgi:hypothetical protein